MAVTITPDKLKEIAGTLDTGMHCFYHLPTGVLETYPDELRMMGDTDDPIWDEAKDKVRKNIDSYLAFEAMNSHESMKVIRVFIANIDDDGIRLRFEDAVNFKKPFQNFKQLLNNYIDLREQWFVYKDAQYIAHVQEQLDYFNRREEHEIDGVE